MSLAQGQPVDAEHQSQVLLSAFTDSRDEWLKAEADLASQGLQLSLFHHFAWIESTGQLGSFWATVRNSQGVIQGAISLDAYPSRALPGHLFMRVQRFGDFLPEAAWSPMLAALAKFARSSSRILRLNIEVFSRDKRDRIADVMRQHGFVPAPPRSYRYTLTMDLAPTEEKLLADLHKSARQNLRPVVLEKLSVVPLTDRSFASKLQFLSNESMRRTGATSNKFNAVTALDLSRNYPELSRVVGLFLAEAEQTPDSLVGFAWGCRHGDHVEYRAAGIKRLENSRLAVSYPLLWTLILWAKREGAAWFDLGGVTLEDSSQEALKGISEFKRFFSRNVEEVGDEWMIETQPFRLLVADRLSSLVKSLKQIRTKFRERLSKTAETGA